MYVRLAFAVAAHLDQDILFVDEVLAVGDAEFQKRCINKMRDISSAGRTVLFVSHNPTALRNLCSTGLLLEEGLITRKGPVDDVLSAYMGGSAGNLTVDLRSRRIADSEQRKLQLPFCVSLSCQSEENWASLYGAAPHSR